MKKICRGIVYFTVLCDHPCLVSGRLYSLDWSGLDWTGVEWTGLTQKSVKCLFQCRTEAKHTYSVTKVACTACFRVFAESVEVKGHVHI